MIRRQARGRSNMGLMLLLLEVSRAGVDRIPPITLATIALNVIIHLTYPSPHMWKSVCIGIQSVWYGQDYSRLLKGAFFHADDWHLYYNMASFLYKGMYLEGRIGSSWFVYMLVVFTTCTNILVLYLNYAAAVLLNDMSYLQQCAVGFSGVIFAVKVLTTYATPPGTSLFFGFIPVNSRMACWFELFLIQFLVPNASFTGHLAGILVGLAYVKGPLQSLMELAASPINLFSTINRRSYTYRSGTAATNNLMHESPHRPASGYDEDEQLRRALSESMRQSNHGNPRRIEPSAPPPDGYDEQLQRALSESLRQSNHGDTPRMDPSAPPQQYGWNVPEVDADTNELRRRRLVRFAR